MHGIALAAAVTCALAAGTPVALANHGVPYGSDQGIADANNGPADPGPDVTAPAFPGPKAWWAGTCDLLAASTTDGGVGASNGGIDPPPSFAHCIAQGTPRPGCIGCNPPRETTWTPGQEPAWRLDPVAQAGAHPDTTLSFWLRRAPHGAVATDPVVSAGDTKTVIVKAPPGVVGNPNAVPKCPSSLLNTQPPTCPPETQVGVATVTLAQGQPNEPLTQGVFPVWNVEARDGKAAELMLSPLGAAARANVPIVAEPRTDGDHGIDALATNLPGGIPLLAQTVTLWGVPWAASHDAFRPSAGYFLGLPEGGLPDGSPDRRPYQPAWGEIRPFMSNPTECAPAAPVTTIQMDTWQFPGAFFSEAAVADAPVDGCGDVPFAPTADLTPTSQAADSPTGLDVEIEISQNDDPPAEVAADPDDATGAPAHWKSTAGRATSHVEDTTVTLPAGMSINPAAAHGQQACTTAQIGLTSSAPIRFDKAAPTCPDASKVGTVKIETPLLDEQDWPEGVVYLAKQGDNPFGSLLAIYIVVESPRRGLRVKLAGKVEADQATGQLTTEFRDNPQLPFERFELHFEAGPRAPLATARTCGTGSATTALAPYAAPDTPTVLDSPFPVSSGPDGSPCPASLSARPFALGFAAGTRARAAGASSPFELRLARPDGAQEVRRLEVAAPEGLVASLRGVPYCSESALAGAASRSGTAERSSPSCLAASQVGTTTVGTGVGPTPFYVGGKAYLAGPYKGAPLSLAIVVPAVAGPFDLGTVVVRSALHVDRRTAKVTAISDPLPQILEGIPLRTRDIRVSLDRPGFMRIPTDCTPKRVEVTAHSPQLATARLAKPFNVTGCAKLPFKPKLSLRLTGKRQTTTGKHPGVRAMVTQRAGQAAIERAEVRLPKALALDPDNAQALCEFEDGTKPEPTCPKGSIVGRASAVSPLLKRPLSGPVYFVKNVKRGPTGNLIRTLPMIVVALRGEIAINLIGESNVRGGRIVNTFARLPDASLSRFDLRLEGGGGGILVVTRTRKGLLSLCSPQTAKVAIRGQNGRRDARVIRVKTPCSGKRGQRRRGGGFDRFQGRRSAG